MIEYINIKDRKFIVQERIDFILKMHDTRQAFKDPKLLQHTSPGHATHPYRHFEGLQIYLALTCFDILGQPSDWLDFSSWLTSKKKEAERLAILDIQPNLSDIEKISFVYNEYNKIYSVRNAFYRFMREILTSKNRKKLLESIWVSVITSSNPPMSSTIEVHEALKEKFLFNARNSFTHKGIPYAHGAAGIFSLDYENMLKDGYQGVYYDENDEYYYSARNWPWIITEILQEVLDTDNLQLT